MMGKIGRLTKGIREQVNLMLHFGQGDCGLVERVAGGAGGDGAGVWGATGKGAKHLGVAGAGVSSVDESAGGAGDGGADAGRHRGAIEG
jgi:hypothetical protein